MFGIKFIKVGPNEFIIVFKGGKVIREGVGLSFYYYSPTTSLVLVPVGSVDVPFIFQEVAADFQQVTVQGQLTYRVSDPKLLSKLMNFTLNPNGKGYTSDDPKKLPQRLIDHAQVLTSDSVKSMSLKEVLGLSNKLVSTIFDGLQNSGAIQSLGIEILGISILAIKPTPDTSRALEAEAREQILREADDAVYVRRNAALAQERALKENEFNTEIAIENKKRQVKETQMEAEKSVQQKRRELQEAEITTKIAIEEKNKELVLLAAANEREEADAKAYSLSAVVKALAQTDPKIIQALTSVNMEPRQLVALAFKEIAESTDKIGQLNISPELLRELLARENPK
jgi:hypothetical protein